MNWSVDEGSNTIITYIVKDFIVNNNCSEQIIEYRFGITNFEFCGTTPKWQNKRGYLVLPLFLPIHNKKIEITIKPIEKYDDILKCIIFLKTINITCEAIISDDNSLTFNEVCELISNLCYVMSLARGTKISWIYCKSYDNSENCIKHYHCDNITKRYTPLPIIDDRASGRDETKIFIEHAYNELFNNPQQSILDKIIIDAYLDAKAEGDFLQSRALKLAVTMEIIKNKYINLNNSCVNELIMEKEKYSLLRKHIKQCIANYSETNALDLNIQKQIENNLAGLNRTSFKTIITSMCSQIGMSVPKIEINNFVDSRNLLVHTGNLFYTTAKGKKIFSSEWQEFLFLLNFIDRIILKALKYEGIYIDWSVPNKPERKSLSLKN